MKSVGVRFLGPLLVSALIFLALTANAVSADEWKFGGRVGYFTDVQAPFVGIEVLAPIAHRVYFNPNVEWVFVENTTYLTFNGDFHYDFPTKRSTYVWLGGGLAVIKDDPEGDNNGDTDVGANFLGGIGWRSGSVIPYFQLKVIAKSDTEVALAFGLRF